MGAAVASGSGVAVGIWVGVGAIVAVGAGVSVGVGSGISVGPGAGVSSVPLWRSPSAAGLLPLLVLGLGSRASSEQVGYLMVVSPPCAELL